MTATSTHTPVRHEPQLLGRTVVVIGGSMGIGLETARRAREEGADVILTARDPDRLRHEEHAGRLTVDCFNNPSEATASCPWTAVRAPLPLR